MRQVRRIVCAGAAHVGGWLAALAFSATAGAATLDITPQGQLPTAGNVHVELSARVAPGATVQDFWIRYNGRDVTSDFVRHALITRTDAGTLTASIDVLFAPGSHAVTASLLMSGEARIDATARFQVPESDQARLRDSLLTRLSEYLQQFGTRAFTQAISLGDLARLRERAADPSFQIYVDPATLDGIKGKPRAAYVEIWNLGLSYYRDLVLRHDPDLYGVGRTPDTEYSPFLLWEEMVHALSHVAPGALPDPGRSADPQDIDHFYLDWAEPCVRTGLRSLATFEDTVAAQHGAVPTDATLQQARGHWRSFVNYCNTTTDARGAPDATQRQAFKALTGFDVDVDSVRSYYLALGVDRSWFDAATVQLLGPAAGTVSTDHVDARATVTLAAGTPLDRVGFAVNGRVVYATLSGNAFAATLPLDLGSNTVMAGIITRATSGTAAEVVTSLPVTVVRRAATPACPQVTTWTNTDQTLFAPLRVTRVDHANVPVAAYYYALANPNDRQEHTLRPTYFTLSGGPVLTRDQSFANNLGLGLYSFASAADARTVWDRELAAWDALPAANRPELLLRDDTMLAWAWTSFVDGQKNLVSLTLLNGSVIAYHSLRSMAGAETAANQGVAALMGHMQTTRGLVDARCGGP